MSMLIGDHAKELCLKLINCETEQEVMKTLNSEGMWTNRDVWRPYGDIHNNRGIVGNQQSSPVAAFVEKLVNSIDAVLTAECLRQSVDPKSSLAPANMTAAVQQFFKVPGGCIQTLSASDRTDLAQKINIVTTGSKKEPNYLIIDQGEGQTPLQFPNTFLSLLRENKTHIPFVQGKFNMGSTGVLQFSGTNSLQLIVSRRQSDLPYDPSDHTARMWGFTIIRRLEPDADQPHSTYVYLAPDNSIPSFHADEMLLKPGRYPEPYSTPITAGTCVKLWNYKFPGGLKTLATLDLRHAFERYLQAPAIPIRISERRQGYQAHYYDTTMSGLLAVISDNPDDVEPGLDTGTPLDIPSVGHVYMRLVVIREGIGDAKKYPSGIFFNVNGQLHGELGSDFLSRKTKLEYISSSLIVIVDCTTLSARLREDLFLASRDRMRQIDERNALEIAIVEYLKDHSGLRELNSKRREARLADSCEEETARVIESLVRRDPTLSAIFSRGEKIRVPRGSAPVSAPYVGQTFPTYFRIAKEPKEGLVKKCPKNRTCRVEMENDAANDYFSRLKDPGHIESRGLPVLSSVHLWNGKATLRYALPTSCNPGDRFQVNVLISDVSRVNAFSSSFVLEADEDAVTDDTSGHPPQQGSLLASLPNVVEVHQDQWATYQFDEYTALVLKYGEDNALDAYVNMDNLYLRNEITRRRSSDPNVIRYWFKYGMLLLALGMLYQQRQHRTAETGEENGSVPDELDVINKASQGLAVTLIPVISQLSEGPSGR